MARLGGEAAERGGAEEGVVGLGGVAREKESAAAPPPSSNAARQSPAAARKSSGEAAFAEEAQAWRQRKPAAPASEC